VLLPVQVETVLPELVWVRTRGTLSSKPVLVPMELVAGGPSVLTPRLATVPVLVQF
jgi:predicted DNA repair protein MutK